MIVINSTKETPTENKHKETLEQLFCKELEAYCAYKTWLEETEDHILEMALEEIMLDEYLHAKFLRDYMKDKDMYTLKEDDVNEKRIWKIQKELFGY